MVLESAIFYTAVLVMDTRASTHTIRSAPGEQGWSRLYHAGPYHVDLSVKGDSETNRIVGQVVGHRGIHQYGTGVQIELDGMPKNFHLDADGSFAFSIPKTPKCSLRFDLGDEVINLEQLVLV